ncbi:unnamed protein product, partial [Trichobilharzia szidati]
SKLNFIMIFGLCMVNIMTIKSDEYTLPMRIPEEGKVKVNFKGINFTLDSQYGLTVRDGDCTYKMKFEPPNKKQEREKSEERQGSVRCNRRQPKST